MENLLKEYLRLQTEKEAVEDKIHPFISKWCEATDKWYYNVIDYDIKDDLSFCVNYSAQCWKGADNYSTEIPKEYFLAADKDKFIADYLAAKRAEAAELAQKKKEKQKSDEERRERETYEKLKNKFDKQVVKE